MFNDKVSKEELEKELKELSATFLGALKQQKEEILELIKKPQEEKVEDQSTCFCFIGAENGAIIPAPIAQLISRDMKALMDQYRLLSITALNTKKSIAQSIIQNQKPQ